MFCPVAETGGAGAGTMIRVAFCLFNLSQAANNELCCFRHIPVAANAACPSETYMNLPSSNIPIGVQPAETDSEETRFELLFSRLNFERTVRTGSGHFKLKNMLDIARWQSNPHLAYPVVHVAGTKGKGSVSTMAGSILSASGLRTGIYTSPHLESVRQRIAIDGGFISEAQLQSVLKQMREMITAFDEQAEQGRRRPVTFFELITSSAFLHFANRNVDAAVFEVGLGGRLDSTNICEPEVTVITNISLDHTRQLGETLEEIAAEKAGIIKPGIPVVSGAINPSAAGVIERIAAENNAPLYVLDRDFFFETSETTFSTFGNVGRKDFRLDRLATGIPGAHQIANASLAVAVAQLMNEGNRGITADSIHAGLSSATLAGRTEVIDGEPAVILDMAHNVASIGALVDAVQQLDSWRNASTRKLVIAISRDKDATGMLRLLTGQFDEIIITRYQTNPRGMDPVELQELATRLRDQMNLATTITVSSEPVTAWQVARAGSDPGGFVCITGSAFLIAELRQVVIARTL